MKTFIVYTDGGARGNPGPAAIGVVVKSETGEILASLSRTIGVATNNVAEYSAVIDGLSWIIKHKANMASEPATSIKFFCDSELVVKQLTGVYRIKDHTLQMLALKVHGLEQSAGGNVSYTAIRREENKDADWLVNKALDGK